MLQVEPSGETWIWKAVAYAASQSRVTSQMDWLEPRSTCSHCGSAKALDHRVLVFPSTAADAGNDEFSRDEAVAGWFSAASVVLHPDPVPPAVP